MIPSPARPPERTQQLLGAYLARRNAGKRASAIPRRGPDPLLPLSFAQEQLWLHAQVAPELPLYNEPMTVYRRGPLDVAALEQTLGEILRRHEAWRTVLAMQDGEAMQVVHPPAPFPLPVVDLRPLPPGDRESEALRLATMDAGRPFDLEGGPLLRARLVHVADDDHRLYLTLHHIIFDGVAIHRVFLPELVALYAAFAAGRPSPLPEPAVQYGDFVRWQRDSAPDPAWTSQLEYWRARLADAPELSLPTDHPRPRVQSFRGALVRFVLPKPLSDGLRTLSRNERATLYMTLLAGFKILLHRYTAGDDIVVGSVTAGRTHPDLESVLGYFVNPVVLRTDLGGDPPFRDVLARVRETTLEALGHADVPFAQVVKALPHQRDPARTPFLQAVISMEMPMPALDAGWRYSQTDISSGLAKFDLDFQVEDLPEGISGRVIYQTDLFEAPTIQRLVGHYQTLLEGIVAAPGRRLSALPLMTPDERHQVLVAWNATTAAYPEHSTVHRLFEAQVDRSPDAVALVLDDRQLTYRQVNQRANQIAHHLQSLGIGPGMSVCVGMERSLDLVLAILGVLKAGGGYVPLDPEYPTERLAFMVRDSGAAALVTEQQFLDRMPHDVPTVCLDAEADAIARRRDTNLATPVSAEHLAYAMYTSGSTGRPKGVAVGHRAILRLLFGQDYVRFGPEQVFLQLGPMSFDASTFEVWGALLHGGRCVLASGRVLTHEALGALIRRHGVTTLFLTTALFNRVVDEAPEALVGLRHLLFGGEMVSVPHVRRAVERLPDTEIIHCYGPTEATTFACCYRVPHPPGPEAITVPIGRPLANTTMYVLDRHRNPVPAGVVGELYIGGPGLARGYLNRPELTAERFVTDPFSTSDNARLYRTGDLVRWRAGGVLEFEGRLDDQVKIRGFRVEPGEIETVLGQHPQIRDVAVVARDVGASGRTLVAYVAPVPGGHVEAGELRAFLGRRLPAHMIPSLFVTLASLPSTPTGKVDRRALPAPGDDGFRSATAGIGPRDPVEAQLAEIWEELLEARPVGVQDDFFDLGGHSLLALGMMHRLGQVYGVRLPLATLYANPTIERLAAVLREEAGPLMSAPMATIHARGSRPPLFLFHGDLSGGGFYCLRIGRGLGTDQPLHVVHPLGRDGQAMPPTVEAMAAMHLAALRAVQPRGPYRIGGYCNGGLVAYEIARMLTTRGESVDLLALIAALPDTRYAALRSVGDRLASLLRLPPTLSADVFGRVRSFLTALEGRPVRERLRLVLGKIASLGGDGVDRRRAGREQAPPGLGDEYFRLYERYFRAVMGYVPRPWPGRIVLFWPVDEPRHPGPDPTLGWGRLAAAVDVHAVPGDHYTVVARHAETIAVKLRAYL